MSLETWISFCILEVVLCLTPGPAVLFVTSRAMAGGVQRGALAAAGIVTGNTIYFVLSATGIAAIIVAAQGIYSALQWAGAAYLIYTGVRMVLQPGERNTVVTNPVGNEWPRGTLVQLANPKALVFFLALLPQFVDADLPVGWQLLILGLTSQLIEIAVLLVYAWLAGQLRHLTGARWDRRTEVAGGVLLVALGARLAWSRS